MRYPYFLCRGDEMWHDSWTYGDYIQYVCNRPNGHTQCARFSQIPVFGLLIGIVLWALVIFSIVMAYNTPLTIDVPYAIGLMTIGTALMVPFILGYYFEIYLMKAVGPMNKGSRRVFPWEEKR